jgi:hypothetical protein
VRAETESNQADGMKRALGWLWHPTTVCHVLRIGALRLGYAGFAMLSHAQLGML